MHFFNRLSILAITTVFLSICSTTHAESELVIELQNEKQIIDGFGASDAWSINPLIKKWESENRQQDIEKLADYLFNPNTGIGLSMWRFNIGAGSAEQGTSSAIPDTFRRAELFVATEGGAIDKTKQAGQVRFLKEAKERGVKNFVAFANSPPKWATKNGLTHPGNGTGIDSTNLRSDKTTAFTDFLAQVVTHLRNNEGIPINYLSPINEPTWEWEDQTQEGNRYNNNDIKSVYRSLYQSLKKSAIENDVSIDGVEIVEFPAALSDSFKRQFDNSTYSGGMNNRNVGKYKNYIDDFLGDGEMKQILDNRISMHGYFSEASSNKLGSLRDLVYQNVQEVSPGAKIWMSEVCMLGGTGDVRNFNGSGWNTEDMTYALHVAKMIHRDMTRLQASGWHWWLSVTPYDYKDGLLKINKNLDSATLQTSKVFWTVGQFSRFVRPGYKRVALKGYDNLNGLMASAYKSENGNKIVVVAVNASSPNQEIKLSIPNLPANKKINNFEIYTTNATNNLAKIGQIENNKIYSIPSNSVVTFVADLFDINSTSSSSSSNSSSTSSSSSNSSSSSGASSGKTTGGFTSLLLMTIFMGMILATRKNKLIAIN
jgi:O-glycosyl hydrolase